MLFSRDMFIRLGSLAVVNPGNLRRLHCERTRRDPRAESFAARHSVTLMPNCGKTVPPTSIAAFHTAADHVPRR